MKKKTRAIILNNDVDRRIRKPVEDRYIMSRELKARKICSVLEDYSKKTPLSRATVLDIGCSIGAIAQYLSRNAGKVAAIDIDREAVVYAKKRWTDIANLEFYTVCGLNIPFADNSFDIIICNGVYEHVEMPKILIDQIYRLLKPGGICYFSAMNKLSLIEPHYNIPLLSILPKRAADLIMMIAGKGKSYDVAAYTCGGLKKLFKRFKAEDITLNIIGNPKKYGVAELSKMSPFFVNIIAAAARLFYLFLPTYLWIIRKDER